MALAIGPGFSPYLPLVLPVLQQAAEFQVDKENYDMVDYCNELRDGCLDAYTGIIQGLKSSDNQLSGEVCCKRSLIAFTVVFSVSDLAIPVQTMVGLIAIIGKDEDKSDTNLSNGLGLLGYDFVPKYFFINPIPSYRDLCTTFGVALAPVVEPFLSVFHKLVAEGKRSRVKRTKSVAAWTAKELKSIQQR